MAHQTRQPAQPAPLFPAPLSWPPTAAAQSIFLEFGAVSFDLAALVAEMLGFNPELVMPFLREQQQQEVELQQQAGEEGRV